MADVTITPSDLARPVRASANAVLAIVAVVQFMVVLDASVVNVALPSIQRAVGFSEQSLSWVLNAYTLLFGGFLLLGGRAADRLGAAACSRPASRCSRARRSPAGCRSRRRRC